MRNPKRQTRRGDACGNSLGMPTAAITRVIDSGMMRSPVSMAESPSAIDRNSGTAKNRPAWSRYWKKNAVSPLRSSRTRRIAGSSSAAWPVSRRCFSHSRKQEQHRAAAEDQPDHRREAQPGRRVGLGLHEAPGAGAQDPVDDQAEPERRERGADEVEAGALLLRGVGGAPVEEQDDADDEHLAHEHVAPRPVGGEQPADQRTERDRDRAAGGDDAVRARPFRLHEVRRDERDDRRHHQRGADAFEERPAEHQHREVRRERGR